MRDVVSALHSSPHIITMLTPTQKLKILQNFLCLIAVNGVYKSGVQTNKEGKEKLAFAHFEAELSLQHEGKGRWYSISEFSKEEFTKDSIRATTKTSSLTSEKIWEKVFILFRSLRPSFSHDFIVTIVTLFGYIYYY